MKREMEISANLQVIEWLKVELVDTVALLFKSLLKAGNDATVDVLATLIIIVYLLAHRLGLGFQVVEMRIKHKINNSIGDLDDIGGDLTYLQKYLEAKDNKKR